MVTYQGIYNLLKKIIIISISWLLIIFVVTHLNGGHTLNDYVDLIKDRYARQVFIPVLLSFIVFSKYKFSEIRIPVFLAALASVGWGIVLPIIKYMAVLHLWNGIKIIGYENSMWDIFCSIWIFTCFLYSILVISQVKFKLLQKILIVLYTLFLVVLNAYPFLELFHLKLYGFFIEQGTIMAIQQTNTAEALEYIEQYLSISVILLVALILLSVIGVLISLAIKWSKNAKDLYIFNKKTLIFYLVVSLSSIYMVGYKNITHTSIYRDWIIVKKYRLLQENYINHSDERVNNIKFLNINDVKKLKGTIILVIGESESREFMHYYNPRFSYENTPWLESERNNKDFIIFNNAFTSYNQTNIALEKAITEKSQYNKINLNSAVSIIEVAKKAGYDTYWYTAQNINKPLENVADRIGSVSKYTGVPKGKNSNNVLDGDLLPLLHSVNPDKNNLIVLHLMGSHVNYLDRYPNSFNKWNDRTDKGAYSNTVLYTDYVLKEIYQYAKSKLNLQVMVYFSDHGEDIHHGHHPGIRKFNQVAIPMFIYVSPSYREIFPHKYIELLKHKDSYYSNDMIYNTMVGIMGAESNHYDKKEDISSAEYGYNIENVMTYSGTVHVNDKLALPMSQIDY